MSDVTARDGYVRLSPQAATRVAKLLATAFGIASPTVLELVEVLDAAATSAGVMSVRRHDASQTKHTSASWTSSSAIAADAGVSTKTVERAGAKGEILRPPRGAYDATSADEWIEKRNQRWKRH